MCRMNKVDFLVVYGSISEKNYFIKDIFRELKIPCLDLSQVLINASKVKPLTFIVDPHDNEFAQEVIGEYVASSLKEKYHLKTNSGFKDQFLGKF